MHFRFSFHLFLSKVQVKSDEWLEIDIIVLYLFNFCTHSRAWEMFLGHRRLRILCREKQRKTLHVSVNWLWWSVATYLGTFSVATLNLQTFDQSWIIIEESLKKLWTLHKKDLIYPASGSSAITAKDLDISVLYILLRNICNIPKHKNGWGKPPKKGDKSIAACIEKIKNERNLISGHSTAGAIEDNESQNHWTELRDAIVEI